LLVGAVSPDVVAVETRKHSQQRQSPTAGGDQVVVSLEQRRLAELTEAFPTDCRPLPTVAAYDSLLTAARDA